MSAARRRSAPHEGGRDWIEIATGRVGKITAFLTAIGAFVLVMLNQSEQIGNKLSAMGWFSPRPCVEVSKADIPNTIEYAEWDNMRIRFEGRNNCDGMLGLYVTFQGRVSSEPRFRLRPPHEDISDCRGTGPVQLPKCWDRKKPVAIGKGEWDWEVLPPPLAQLSDPTPSATISVSWEVRNVDQPDKPPLASDLAQIVVTNKAARP